MYRYSAFSAACFASPLAWILADAFLNLPAFIHCLHKLQKAKSRSSYKSLVKVITNDVFNSVFKINLFHNLMRSTGEHTIYWALRSSLETVRIMSIYNNAPAWNAGAQVFIKIYYKFTASINFWNAASLISALVPPAHSKHFFKYKVQSPH